MVAEDFQKKLNCLILKSNSLLKGLQWSFLEKFSVVGIQIILEIILARLLLPVDYGVLGMIMVVVAFANVFIDGGISSALIHYQDRDQFDYAVVFYSSVGIGIMSYILIYFCAPYLSEFYRTDLTLYIRVIALSVLFNSVGILYRAKLSIRMDFKKQTFFSLIAVVISGIVAIGLAFLDKGVWALIVQLIIYSTLLNMFLLLNDRTIPPFVFRRHSVERIFNFGSKIFFSSVLHALYVNAFPLLLGKFYNSKTVGLYTKSNQISTYPAGMFAATFQRVLFPYLVTFQNDTNKIFNFNLQFVKIFSLIAFPIVIWIFYYAHPIIIFLFSSSWEEMVMPFRFLLLSSALFPIIIMNMNIYQVTGKVNGYLFAEVASKCVGIVILLLLFKYGFFYVCLGIFIQFFLQFVYTSISSSLLLDAPLFKQFLEVLKPMFLNTCILLLTISSQEIFSNGFVSLITLLIGTFAYFFLVRIMYQNDYISVVNLIRSKITKG